MRGDSYESNAQPSAEPNIIRRFCADSQIPATMPMTEAVAKMVGRFEKMERIDQYAFYKEMRSHFLITAGFCELLTSHYDEMKRFYEHLEMEVSEHPGDPILHWFGPGRVASVRRGDVLFQLRESPSESHGRPFNLYLDGYSPAAIERLRSIGYSFREETGMLGGVFHFTAPDGGQVMIGL